MRLATVLTPMSDQNLALAAQCGVTSTDELWRNLEQCLRLLVPVAEASGVTMCMHPDGPLAAALLGQDRIMNSVENFERLVTLVPSRSNAICFC
jgi:mannonate dehydratase